jgi:hypothetical protein
MSGLTPIGCQRVIAAFGLMLKLDEAKAIAKAIAMIRATGFAKFKGV